MVDGKPAYGAGGFAFSTGREEPAGRLQQGAAQAQGGRLRRPAEDHEALRVRHTRDDRPDREGAVRLMMTSGMFTTWFLPGLWITIQVTVYSAALAAVVAFVVGLLRTSDLWIVRFLSGVYFEIFRGTSALVLMFWMVFALPLLLGWQLGPDVGGRERTGPDLRRLRLGGRARRARGRRPGAARGGHRAELHQDAAAAAHRAPAGAARDDAAVQQPADRAPQGHGAGVDHHGGRHDLRRQPGPARQRRQRPRSTPCCWWSTSSSRSSSPAACGYLERRAKAGIGQGTTPKGLVSRKPDASGETAQAGSQVAGGLG